MLMYMLYRNEQGGYRPMDRRRLVIWAVVIVLITSVVNYGVFFYAPVLFPNSLLARLLPSSVGRTGTANYTDFNLVYQYIKRYYPDDVDDQKLVEGATAGLVAAVGDPYSYYMDPTVYADFMEKAITGKYTGIGVSIELKDNYVTVMRAFKDSPAEKGGLRPGDRIVGVDGTTVIGATLDAVRDMVRGDEGTAVTLTIMRPEVELPFDVTVTRAQIQTPTVFSRFIEDGIAYIQIDSFDQTTDQEFVTQLQALRAEQKIKGMILDLRYNPGGTLEDSVNVAEYFVPSGPIVVTVDKAGNRETSGDGHSDFDFPVVVLVNDYSASAAEVVTGAIQDAGTATIIGTKTFGKGSVQIPIELSGGAALRLTIARWRTPKDRTIDKIGIQPDISVERPRNETPSNMDAADNPSVKQALAVIHDKLGR